MSESEHGGAIRWVPRQDYDRVLRRAKEEPSTLGAFPREPLATYADRELHATWCRENLPDTPPLPRLGEVGVYRGIETVTIATRAQVVEVAQAQTHAEAS